MSFQKAGIFYLSVLLKSSLLLFSGLLLQAQQELPPFSSQFFEIKYLGERNFYVHQELIFSKEVQAGDTLWFYHYLNAYSTIKSSLGKALTDKYKLEFHFSHKKDRSSYRYKKNPHYQFLDSIDIQGIILNKTFRKNDTLTVSYNLKLPLEKFTGIGYKHKNKSYFLKDWLLQPGIPSRLYHHANLEDRPVFPVQTRIKIYGVPHLHWNSNANIKQIRDTLFLEKQNNYIILAGNPHAWEIYETEHIQWVLESGIFKENSIQLSAILSKIDSYLTEKKFPYSNRILITKHDLQTNPVFGADWLPLAGNFPVDFKTSINVLKQILYQSGRNMYIDLRGEYAFHTGIWQYYIIQFVRDNFPDVKMAGSIPGLDFLQYYHLFRVPYNYKYQISYQYMARMNKDQALNVPADRLSLFNRNITAPYKMAIGWEIAGKYAGETALFSGLSNYLKNVTQKPGGMEDFMRLWNQSDAPSISFLFKDFYQTAQKADFRFKKDKSSSGITIINPNHYYFPVLLSRIHESGEQNEFVFIPKDTSIRIKNLKKTTIRLNQTPLFPEINRRNNTYPPTRKPIIFRFFKDLENPWSYQFFFNPSVGYNYYDGLILGLGLNNMSFLDKNFQFEAVPEYALKSRAFTGKFRVKYFKHFTGGNFFGYSVGAYANRYHYSPEYFYHNGSIHAKISFKDPDKQFRTGQDYTAEYTWVNKDAAQPDETTRYGIFFITQKLFKNGLIKNYKLLNRMEFHPLFFKISGEYKFRTFLDKFRQLEFRIFAGWMPYNKTQTDYFSFALSRPTDYLFKYNYYGRSETSGLFYQQYIYAEGGFKVFYDHQYANEAILVNNINLGLYKRFNFFLDYGWIKNRNQAFSFHYNGGIRYYLVPDYFEFYFPLFSDQGWMKFDKNYLSKIRIMFVFDLPNLFKLISRSWY